MVRTLLFFASPVWAAWWLSLMLAAADVQEEESCSPRLCGNVAISFPFEVVPEQAEVTKCGWLGFQVTCANNTPYLGYNRLGFQILDIFYDNASLLVVDIRKYCHVRTINSSSKLGPPFSMSPANQNLIFYNCTKAPVEWHHRGLVETECRNRTFVRVAGRYNETGNYDGYALEGCNATWLPAGTGGVWQGEREQLQAAHQGWLPLDMAAAACRISWRWDFLRISEMGFGVACSDGIFLGNFLFLDELGFRHGDG